MRGDDVAYPRELEQAIVLKDGVRVRSRPVRPDDAEGLSRLYDRLSRTTAYQRFFKVYTRLPPEWAHDFANVDYQRRLAIVAEHDAADGPELIAVARYEPSDEPDTGEVALVVQDDWQGKGLGSRLLRDLLAAAAARGIHRFCAYVLVGNDRMLGLLSRLTIVEKRAIDSGVVTVTFTRPKPTPGVSPWNDCFDLEQHGARPRSP